MKTKILMSLFALVISGTMAFAQDTTKVVKKEMMKTNTEIKSDSVKKTVKSETGVNNSPALVTYTCTMHHEVTADKPGKCPKCGMDLVVKK